VDYELGMVGYLEDRWPTTAAVVVAMIAPAAFYALAPIKPPASRSGATERARSPISVPAL
jgi:hypothetical protein